MTRQELIQQIQAKKSYLCVGLDTDLSKIPKYLQSHPDAIFEFNKQIIDATQDLCVSYKINTAFYEAMGLKGWEAMQQTVDYIPSEQFTIADAKRGDIGNTSTQYARAFFEALNFDAITVAPYMGEDSVRPFLEYENTQSAIYNNVEITDIFKISSFLSSFYNKVEETIFAVELVLGSNTIYSISQALVSSAYLPYEFKTRAEYMPGTHFIPFAALFKKYQPSGYVDTVSGGGMILRITTHASTYNPILVDVSAESLNFVKITNGTAQINFV